MDKVLVADVNLFTLNSPIYLIEDGHQNLVGTYRNEDFPEAIVMICRNHNVNRVKLHGIPAYTLQLRTAIQEQEMKQYSKNSINIEVI